MIKWRAVVRNEDVVPVFTTAKPTQDAAYDVARAWLLGYTDAQRREIGTIDTDDGWMQTLMDNGFYSIAMYEEF